MFPSAKLALPALLLLALGACGDSDDDDSDGTPPEDAVGEGPAGGEGTYLIGGGGCLSESASAASEVDAEAAGDVAGPDVPAPGDGDDSGGDVAVCADDPTTLASTGLLPTGEGTLRIDGREYALDSAVLVSFAGDVDSQLVLHDGETRVARSSSTSGDDVERGYAYGVYDASAALSIALVRASPEDELSGQTYELVRGDGDGDVEEQALAGGTAVAIDALLVVDMDGDGTVSPGEELFEPASGRIVWSGTEAAPSLSFDFVLEDGRSVEGSYEGSYELIE